MPNNVIEYGASISVDTDATDGMPRSLFVPVVVRRIIDVYFDEASQIGQIFPPEPVSACIPGGPSSVMTEYSETTSETRTRGTQRALSRGWESSYGTSHQVSYNASTTVGFSETRSSSVTTANTNMVGGSTMVSDLFSDTSGRMSATTASWNNTEGDMVSWGVGHEDSLTRARRYTIEGRAEVNGEVNGELNGGIPGVIGGEVGTRVGGSVALGGGTTWGRDTGTRDSIMSGGGTMSMRSVGGSRTMGEMLSTTRARTYADQRSWGQSQTYSETTGFNTTRSLSRTESFGEALTTSQGVSESLGTTETEILTVSTTESESLRTSAWVWAGQYGMWYRQAVRLVRIGSVVAYDLCGNGTEVGTVQLEDWAWAPDLAIGEMCPPPSNLPAAECRVPPC